jgi:hypothetical protein
MAKFATGEAPIAIKKPSPTKKTGRQAVAEYRFCCLFWGPLE